MCPLEALLYFYQGFLENYGRFYHKIAPQDVLLSGNYQR